MNNKIKLSNFLYSFLLIMIVSNYGFGQEKSFKTYANFLTFSDRVSPFHNQNNSEKFAYDGISFAFRKINSKDFAHQIEAKFNRRKSDEIDNKYESLFMSLRYDFSSTLKKKLFKVLTARFGKSIRMHYTGEKIDSKNYYEYPVERLSTGFTFFINSSLEIKLTKKIYIELSALLSGIYLGADINRYDDPRFIENQIAIGGFNLDYLNERILRIGLGINI